MNFNTILIAGAVFLIGSIIVSHVKIAMMTPEQKAERKKKMELRNIEAQAEYDRVKAEHAAEMAKIKLQNKKMWEELATDVKIESTTIMRCPECQSDNVGIIGENRKSFSAKKAVAGAVLTGGIGAIAGFAGKKNGYDCFCGDCKHRFLLKDK